jgi:hypothetical protein
MKKPPSRNIEEFIAIVGNLPLSDVTTLTMDAWRADREQAGRASNHEPKADEHP